MRTIDIPAYRGMIVDRGGQPIAISTVVDSIWINPSLFHPSPSQLDLLAHYLRLNPHKIQQQANLSGYRSFVYLKRRNLPPIGEQVLSLHIPGVFVQHEYKRYYPAGEVFAHLIGITNVDDHGQEGLELAYDELSRGRRGRQQVIKDRLGHIIAHAGLLQKPLQGRPLILSVDHRIQYSAYQALELAIAQYHAVGGSIVVLDSYTNEVLAMVNQPSYNPNDRSHYPDSRYRNRAVTDIFEPGSTIKPFTIALALQSGKYTTDSVIDTRPGWMQIGGYHIADENNYGIITLSQVLEKSSDIGAAKIMLSLSPQKHWELLHRLGFGELTGSAFPGEVSGRLIEQQSWRPSVIATLAYGYGIAVTALQLAHAYTVFANQGELRPLFLLKTMQAPKKSETVIPPNVCQKVLLMLENVVAKGTGTRAQIPGYRVAGKTGTAYIAGPHGYDKQHYVSSFVGIAPVSKPRLVVAVVIRDPQGDHLGAIVSAPVFAKVMGESLRILNVSPDQPK